jgi:CRP/FNR family transcriptional regulator, cyclic AMP receptor protein
MRKALEILGRLQDADVEWLIDQGATRHVPAGTVLIDAGVPLLSMYIVLDGQMKVLAGPARTVVATLLAGEILGEISIVDPRPPEVAVVASMHSHVLEISRTAIMKRLAESEAFAARFYLALASYMAARLRATTTRLGYGQATAGHDADTLDDRAMEDISKAATYFDGMLQRLRSGVHINSF